MLYRPLGKTTLSVSALCLGTMTWGKQNSAKDAFAQIDVAQAAGINFIDTAEMYPVPPESTTYGETERILGQYFNARKNREQWILASKVAAPGNGLTHMRNGDMALTRKNIHRAIDDSLQRLQTDYLDLYQLHWPDRPTNFFGKLGYEHQDTAFTEIAETLEALNTLVQSGKVRYIGLSNETPWGLNQFLSLAKEHDWPRVVSIQNPYNLLNRSFEVGLAEIAIREQCGLLAYSPLAFGRLTGKYNQSSLPENARLNLFSRFQRYNNPQALSACEKYLAVAKQFDLNPAQMALAFVTSRPFVTSNIIGATNLQQLAENIDSLNLSLSAEVLEALESVHQQQPNPAP